MRSAKSVGLSSRQSARSKSGAALLQKLEARTLFSSNLIPTALEVYAVELINRARANPTAEVQRLASNSGWGGTPDLNEGLPAGTISTAAKQPLAINTILTYTAHNHSVYMITTGNFSHNEGSVNPFQRISNAGYPSSNEGENIATEGSSGTLNSVTATADEQDDLFIDGSTSGRGHRTNIESTNYNEVGAGVYTGVVDGFNTLDLTQDFGGAGGTTLCGITYNDTSADNFFEPGEEIGGVAITAKRTSDNATFSTTTWASGGYSLPLANGTYTVTASGSSIGAPSAKTVVINGSNVEADFQPGAVAVPVTLTGLNEYLKLDADGTSLDVYAGTSATGTPTKYVISQISSLTVAPTAAGTGVLTVDYSAGNPLPSSGLSVNGSAAGVSLSAKILGTTGNDTLTVNATQIMFSSSPTITYAGLTGIVFDGGAGADTLEQAASPGAPLNFANSTSSDTLSVVVGTYTFPQSTGGVAVVRLGTLDVSGFAHVVMSGPASHATRTLLVVSNLHLNLIGSVDFGGNDVDLPASTTTLAAATSLLRSGYDGGDWAGAGFRSSKAAGDTSGLTTLGVIQNNESGTALFTAANPFDGTTPAVSDTLIKYTFVGDTNLDGKVDASDYSRIDSAFQSQKTGNAVTTWFNGDFNYDQVVNGSDYTLIDNAFNRQGATLADQVASAIATPKRPAVAAVFSQTAKPLTAASESIVDVESGLNEQDLLKRLRS